VKSLEVLHPSFAVYVGVLVAALVVIGAVALTSPGAHGHLVRLGKCAIAGVIAATALVIYVDSKRHAQLVVAAARPVNGHPLPVAYLLADGFAGTALIVTVALFAVVTLAWRRRGSASARRPVSSRTIRTGWPE
jgi:hypothetical protein